MLGVEIESFDFVKDLFDNNCANCLDLCFRISVHAVLGFCVAFG